MQALGLGKAYAFFSENTRAMGIVYNQMRTLRLAQGLYFGEQAKVAIHRIHTFYHYKYLAFGLLYFARQVFHIIVFEIIFLGKREPCPLTKAGVNQLIAQDGIALLGHGGQQRGVGLIAGVENEASFRLEEHCQIIF